MSIVLLATDQQCSVLQALSTLQRQTMAYAPYGHHEATSGSLSLLGFNGERPDAQTGHYLLGNGYRAFNPVLMRFNTPDSLSPFGEGGLNAYAYCVGDPINRRDPTGHMKRGLLPALPPTLSPKPVRVVPPVPLSAESAPPPLPPRAGSVPPPLPPKPGRASQMNTSQQPPTIPPKRTLSPPPELPPRPIPGLPSGSFVNESGTVFIPSKDPERHFMHKWPLTNEAIQMLKDRNVVIDVGLLSPRPVAPQQAISRRRPIIDWVRELRGHENHTFVSGDTP